MGSNPMVRSVLTGAVMQLLMVLIGKFVPALGQIPNFYAIAGTVLAALTGAMFSKSSPAATTGGAAGGGAVAGGVSSVIGGIAAAASGQWPGFAVVQLLFPLISGGAGGGIGAVLGKMLGQK